LYRASVLSATVLAAIAGQGVRQFLAHFVLVTLPPCMSSAPAGSSSASGTRGGDHRVTYVYVVINEGGDGAAPAAAATPWVGAATAQPEPEAAPATEEEGPCRWYAVWKIPGRPELTGVYRCAEPNAWAKLEALLPGGWYIGSGARLRRGGSLEDVLEIYRQGAAQHRVALEPDRHNL